MRANPETVNYPAREVAKSGCPEGDDVEERPVKIGLDDVTDRVPVVVLEHAPRAPELRVPEGLTAGQRGTVGGEGRVATALASDIRVSSFDLSRRETGGGRRSRSSTPATAPLRRLSPESDQGCEMSLDAIRKPSSAFDADSIASMRSEKTISASFGSACRRASTREAPSVGVAHSFVLRFWTA